MINSKPRKTRNKSAVVEGAKNHAIAFSCSVVSPALTDSSGHFPCNDVTEGGGGFGPSAFRRRKAADVMPLKNERHISSSHVRTHVILWQASLLWCIGLPLGTRRNGYGRCIVEYGWYLISSIFHYTSDIREAGTMSIHGSRFQELLMYKSAVYRLVNGGITHQKQQLSKKRWWRSNTSLKCQCTAAQYHLFQIFAVFDV